MNEELHLLQTDCCLHLPEDSLGTKGHLNNLALLDALRNQDIYQCTRAHLMQEYYEIHPVSGILLSVHMEKR